MKCLDIQSSSEVKAEGAKPKRTEINPTVRQSIIGRSRIALIQGLCPSNISTRRCLHLQKVIPIFFINLTSGENNRQNNPATLGLWLPFNESKASFGLAEIPRTGPGKNRGQSPPAHPRHRVHPRQFHETLFSCGPQPDASLPGRERQTR